MNFFQAMKLVMEGRKVTKQEWGDDRIVILLHGDRFSICLPENNWQPIDFVVRYADMVGEDYQEVIAK